jgi:type IV secretory pathway TrbF-like protein
VRHPTGISPAHGRQNRRTASHSADLFCHLKIATEGVRLESETPYQRAAQAWDERIGSARVQAKNWRLMAFGSLALSMGLAGGLVWQSTHGSIVPWVVQVDKLGQAQAVAPATADYARVIRRSLGISPTS